MFHLADAQKQRAEAETEYNALALSIATQGRVSPEAKQRCDELHAKIATLDAGIATYKRQRFNGLNSNAEEDRKLMASMLPPVEGRPTTINNSIKGTLKHAYANATDAEREEVDNLVSYVSGKTV